MILSDTSYQKGTSGFHQGGYTCEGDGERDVDGGEEPEEDDGEEAAHGEEDERAPAVNNRPDEEEQAEEGADAQQGHRHRPPDGLDAARAAHA